jgi:hypothetical protein
LGVTNKRREIAMIKPNIHLISEIRMGKGKNKRGFLPHAGHLLRLTEDGL